MEALLHERSVRWLRDCADVVHCRIVASAQERLDVPHKELTELVVDPHARVERVVEKDLDTVEWPVGDVLQHDRESGSWLKRSSRVKENGDSDCVP